jgi:type II secretory pathway pseudopilin PulG
MVLNKKQQQGGFSLVEILIVSAIMLVVFGGLLISFRYSLELISHSRAKLTALTLANDNMEYIRSLSYNAVGTVSGIPSGLIPQVSTTSLNGITFTKRVLVEYIDDDADGLGAADSNGITTDYKQAKVTLEWTLRGVTKEVFLVSNIIPRSIETDVGGGTVRVNVFDFDNVPLPGASVRLVNNSLIPTIDVTRAADASGIALFGGAPAGGGYEIFVTAPGYSTDQTYQATTSLPNPTTQPIAVVESSISTMNFFIDELSNLDISILTDRIDSQSVESFNDSAGIATSTDVVITGGEVTLAGGVGTYTASGVMYLQEIAPSPLSGWDYIIIEGTNTPNTNMRVQFYTGTPGSYVLVPEGDLPGNTAGFPLGAISLRGLSANLFPGVTVGVMLTTTDSNDTPQVTEMIIGYSESDIPLSSDSVELRGTKTIGTLADSSVVYKNVHNVLTNGAGEVSVSNIESDEYTAFISGYDIAESCPAEGLNVDPGTSIDLQLLLAPNAVNSMRVAVETAGGSPIVGVEVELSRSGYSETKITTGCGQVFFDGMAADIDYELNLVAPGYAPYNATGITISGDEVQIIAL